MTRGGEQGGRQEGSGRMRLYSGPLSMFGAKAEIAALEKGLDVELVMVPFDMQRLYEPKHPEVARINPKRQVPVLVDGDLEIFDSTQIFEYFEDLRPEPALWPMDAKARARARQIEHRSDEVYFPPIIRLMSLQDKPQDPVAVAARDASAAFYAEMEKLFEGGDYLAGGYSYADIAFYMAQLFGERMGARMTEATPKLLAWRDRITLRPAVRKVVGAMAAYLVSQGRPLPSFVSGLVPPTGSAR
jgi:glutathione S-transferase